jgi:ATP-binding cassette subfamily C (CFTR/MRP) protein 1
MKFNIRLKILGWELSFRTLLEKIREGELGVLLKMGIYNTIISFSWGAASFLLATASFIVYILIDENNNLDASTAFVSLTLFNIIRFPLMIFPQVITSLIQANVSMTRIRKFLLKDEIDELQISHKPMEGENLPKKTITLN